MAGEDVLLLSVRQVVSGRAAHGEVGFNYAVLMYFATYKKAKLRQVVEYEAEVLGRSRRRLPWLVLKSELEFRT